MILSVLSSTLRLSVSKAGEPYVLKPQETSVLLQRVLLAERDSERAKRQKLEQDVIIARLEALNSKTTTEKALISATEDVLIRAFDEAEVVDFWLPVLSLQTLDKFGMDLGRDTRTRTPRKRSQTQFSLPLMIIFRPDFLRLALSSL